MKLTSLHDLIIHELKDLYDAEQQIQKALPLMSDKATHQELKLAFTDHLKETGEHINRLQKIGRLLDIDLSGEECQAIRGLIKEAQETLEVEGNKDVIDAALIAQAQRIEHYEIAGYGSIIAFADQLDLDNDIIELLNDTIEEEGNANKQLTTIAEGGWFTAGVNSEAENNTNTRHVTA